MEKDSAYWLSGTAVILFIGLLMEVMVMVINDTIFISGIGVIVALLLFLIWGIELLGQAHIRPP